MVLCHRPFRIFFLVSVSTAWPLSYLSGSDNLLSPTTRTAKVINGFFPVPVDDECISTDNQRTGICLNAYECKIQQGQPKGQCAMGFGVCCVFTVTCDGEVKNNITYFVNPKFPGLSKEVSECSIRISKIANFVSQLRLDFIHFTVAQPNRRTGVCEYDSFSMSGNNGREVKLCGQNSGQHMYYDVENVNDSLIITMNMTKENTGRLWEIKILQIEMNNKAPAGCFQYYTEDKGIIQTMNFADNGRHLANQDYTICMRQGKGRCSIIYEPCDENSFRIGPLKQQAISDEGSGFGEALPQARECSDRILMPCDSEEFIGVGSEGEIPGLCDLLHCGSSFCTPGENPCRIESSSVPFNIGVQFGPGNKEESPEDNIGMCLKYDQQSC